MGWIWGSGDDSVKKLDPSLQDFLDKQSPTAQKPEPPAPEPTEAQRAEAEAAAKANAPLAPPQSQFPDGRYADLWKTYTPLYEIEGRNKTDNEKMADIVDSFNERKHALARAARENCIFYHMEINNCIRNGTWYDRMTSCSAQTQAYSRCYETNKKFLKALGYSTALGQGQAAEERIQLRAGGMYERFVEQQKAIEEAKAKGEPVPQFENIFSQDITMAVVAGKEPSASAAAAEEKRVATSLDDLPGLQADMRQQFEDRLSKLEGAAREIELQAIVGEYRTAHQTAERVQDFYEMERRKRHRRREEGRETIGDQIKKIWGWD